MPDLTPQKSDNRAAQLFAISETLRRLKFGPTRDLTAAQLATGSATYRGYSEQTKTFIHMVQFASARTRDIVLNELSLRELVKELHENPSAYNEQKVISILKTITDSSTVPNDMKELAKVACKDATPLPSNSRIYRWQSGLAWLENAQRGLMLISEDHMSTSASPTATAHFGADRLIIHTGTHTRAKALYSYGSGRINLEWEITILPNQRYVLLDIKKVTASRGSARWEIELLMLPTVPS